MDRFEIANRIQRVITSAHPEYCDRHTLRECVDALRAIPPEADQRDAERFRHLQNLPVPEAQAFFWTFQSRKQRAAAIDADMRQSGDNSDRQLAP